MPTPDDASHPVHFTKLISVCETPLPAPASSGCSENRKFSFNSPPPSGPPVPSRSLGSTARAGPRCFAPEGFNLHTRRRVGPRPRGSQVPAPPRSLPASGPQSRPETRASPRAAPSLRPPSLRRCAHPLPAERGSPGRQSVTCSARRARAGADRQTDTPAPPETRAPGPQVQRLWADYVIAAQGEEEGSALSSGDSARRSFAATAPGFGPRAPRSL